MTKFAISPDLDSFDLGILAAVQADNQLTHAQIGAQAGLSASAVRRRLAVLRASGVIRRDCALLDPDAFGVTLIVDISFGEETPEQYAAFDAQMRSLAPVQFSYHVAGETDYVLIVHGPSLKWYEEWAKEVLMSNPVIRRYSTRVAWSYKKFDPTISVVRP